MGQADASAFCSFCIRGRVQWCILHLSLAAMCAINPTLIRRIYSVDATYLSRKNLTHIRHKHDA